MKYCGVVVFYGYSQRTPFFATTQEVRDWARANKADYDIIAPVSNWQEVQQWQNDPNYPAHYRVEGAWTVNS